MHPLSFVIAFGVLGMLSTLGVISLVTGSRGLLKSVGGFTPLRQHFHEERSLGPAALYGVLVTVGIIMLAYGLGGVYRAIWVAP